MIMTQFVIYLALVLVGACMGSFAGAQTWRLRAFQLKADKKAGEKVDAAEYKQLEPLTKTTLKHDRSRCLHCGYVLRWYDLIPVFSWLSLRGKCRHCHKPIGAFELVIELGMIAFFVLSFALWPTPLTNWHATASFVLWLGSGVVLAMLFAYDAKWFLLPDRLNGILIGIGALISIVSIATAANPLSQLWGVLAGVAILSGLYLVLYYVSKQRWVGFGDVKLGLGLALLLADWRLALIALFAANLVGSLTVIPGLISGKLKSRSHVPFGPFLIIGAIIAQLAGVAIINFYWNNFLFY